jgi:uncharacterized membrane protein
VSTRRERGQSSVELALVLPAFVLLVLVVVQVAVLVRDRLALGHAVRVAARAVIVDPSEAAARTALRRVGVDDSVTVDLSGGRASGDLIRVTVTVAPTAVPLVGRVVAGERLRESLTVMVEGPP